MLIKTSKWSVLYYFFNNLLSQIITILVIASSFMAGLNIKSVIILIFCMIAIRIIKGIILAKAYTIYVDEQSVIVNKKVLSNKQTKIMKSDIQSVKLKESLWGHILHVVDLDIAIRENIIEGQNISIKCIREVDKNIILSLMGDLVEKEDINLGQGWSITRKKILLSATMSLSWGYIISLAYLREEFKEMSDIPVLKIIFGMFEKFFEQKYEILAYIELFVIGILLAIISNIMKYYNFKVNIQDGTMYVSRGLLNTYKFSIKLDKISSVYIKESVFSYLAGGYGKLVAEGSTDEEDKLSLTILPFEEKEKIKFYMSKWLNIQHKSDFIAKKRTLVKILEIIYRTLILLIIDVIALNIFELKYFVLAFALSILIFVNMIIKTCYSYISVDNNTIVVYKAGISSKTIFINRAELASLEVENNFLQRKLKCSSLLVGYISCNKEYEVKFTNYENIDVEKIVNMWKI